MKRESRIKLLKRIAAKQSNLEPVKGKKSKKEVQKSYVAAKKLYDGVAAELRKAKEQLGQLQSFVDENEAREAGARKEMKRCSDILQNMDFACADTVRIGRDDEDVAYSCDGKWCRYNADGHTLEPYKKKVKEEAQDVQDAIDKEIDTFVETIPEDHGEGVDLTIGEGIKL